MASAWADYTDFTKQPPGDPDPGMADPIGHAHFAAYAASQESAATQSGSTAKPGTAPDAVNRPQQQNYTPYTPTARNAYGPYLTGDIQNRTLTLDATTRVDPYSGQRYNQGSDGTWRESGFLSRDQQQGLLNTGAQAPVGQEVRAQTGAMPGNPGLRGGAGQAGMGGTLGPRDAPNFSSLNNFQVPGLGFNAGDYRQVQGVNLDSVKLPTTVTPTNYGFDFGHPPSFQGTKSYGPAESGVTMPNYQVPNNYMGGPSGFTMNPSGQAYFQPMTVPLNISSPTFADLVKSAPAQIQPTMPPATPTAAATPNPDNAIRTSAPGPNLTSALGHPVADYSSRGYIPGAAAQPGAAQPGATPQTQQFTGPAQPQVTPGAGGGMTVNGHNLSPEVVSAVTQAFTQAGHPEAINQMLAIAARESGGDPTADNSKSGPGGTPLNNQYQKPDSPYYNTVDYGLFGINEKNFANLGLTPETAKDPVANANAAAKLYGSSGFRPWTGGGTVPLPPVANGGQSTPGAPGAAGAAGANWDYFPPLGPGQTQSAGLQTPGGGAGLYINGPQTAEIRNGGTGMGFNMDTIVKDYGRSAIAPQDPIGKAVAALSLMNAQTSLMNNKDAPAKTPLDAFLSLTTPSTANYGAPSQGSLPPSQAAPTSGLTPAQVATLSGQAPGAQPQTGPVPGSPGAAPSSSQAADQAAAQAAAQAQAQAAQNNGERDNQQYYAQGGTVQVVGPPRMKQADSYNRQAPSMHSYATGGTVTSGAPGPGAGAATAPGADAAAPGTVAPVRTTDEMGGSLVPQQNQNQQSQPLAQNSADLSAASNTQAQISPIQSGQTSSVDPGSPAGIASLNEGTGQNAAVYQPYNDALTYLSGLNQRRANSSAFKLAGITPQGVNTLLPGQSAQQLPASMYYDPTSLITGRIGDIKSLQDQIAAYGQPGSVADITAQETPLQNMQGTFNTIGQLQQSIAGYGNIGTPDQINKNLNDVGALIDKYGKAQGYQTSLAQLGQVGDPGQIDTQIQGLKSEMAPYQAVQDFKTKLAGYGPQRDPAQIIADMQTIGANDPNAKMTYDDYMREAVANQQRPDSQRANMPSWESIQAQQAAYAAQTANLQIELNKAQSYQQDLQTLNTLDPTGQAISVLGTKQTALDQLQNSYADAMAKTQSQGYYQNLLNSLNIAPGTDVNAEYGKEQTLQQQYTQQLADATKVADQNRTLANLQGTVGDNTQAGVQAQLTALEDQLTRSRKLSDTQTQLGNLLGAGVPGAGKLPGFAQGGSVQASGGYQPPPDSSGKNLAEMMRQMGGLGVTAGQWDPNWNIHQNPAHFAKGGNWIAGATQNSHGQFRAKAQAAGMSTGAYASKMADAPGRTGKQARLAKTLMSMHAGGGSMVTQEPIVGVGTVTGKPRFMVGEPHYPGGPPMKERLKITPLNKPNTRLPGGSHRAA